VINKELGVPLNWCGVLSCARLRKTLTNYGDLVGAELELSVNGVMEVSGVPLQRTVLAKLRLKALRRGVWFRKVEASERKLMDLVIRIVDMVRSRFLAKVLFRIVNKLLEAMEGEVSRLMRTTGRDLAQKLSNIAQAWGNESAVGWSNETGFVRFVTIMNLHGACV